MLSPTTSSMQRCIASNRAWGRDAPQVGSEFMLKAAVIKQGRRVNIVFMG